MNKLRSLAVVGMVIKIQCFIIPRKFIILNINLFQLNSLEKEMGGRLWGRTESDTTEAT